LSSGVLKSGTIEKTVDGKDYKVSFVKGAVGSFEGAEQLPALAPTGIVVNDYSKAKHELTAPGREPSEEIL